MRIVANSPAEFTLLQRKVGKQAWEVVEAIIHRDAKKTDKNFEVHHRLQVAREAMLKELKTMADAPHRRVLQVKGLLAVGYTSKNIPRPGDKIGSVKW